MVTSSSSTGFVGGVATATAAIKAKIVHANISPLDYFYTSYFRYLYHSLLQFPLLLLLRLHSLLTAATTSAQQSVVQPRTLARMQQNLKSSSVLRPIARQSKSKGGHYSMSNGRLTD
jgi:hypothetical protein